MSELNEFSTRKSSSNYRNPVHYERRNLKRRKHRNKKTIVIVTAAVIVVLAVISSLVVFGGNSKSDVLAGTWKYDEYTVYEFSGDGTGFLCVDDVHYEYKYKISGDKLELDFVKNIVRDCEYTFTVENSKLTLVGGEGTDKGTYNLNKAS